MYDAVHALVAPRPSNETKENEIYKNCRDYKVGRNKATCNVCGLARDRGPAQETSRMGDRK